MPFYDGDPLDDHRITPKHKGGEDYQENRRLVPRWCIMRTPNDMDSKQ